MHEYVAHSEKVGRYTVKVCSDSDYSLADAVCCDPVMIFGRDRGSNFAVLDQSKRNFPSFDVLRAIANDDSQETLNLICDCRYSDWQWRNGKVWAEHADWTRGRYFKTIETACAAMFRAEYGAQISDLRVETFSSRVWQSCPEYYLCFWQSELDAYAGGKNVPSPVTSCQNIVDGDVYYFAVIDDDGETVDSCGGFIGESEYCLSEGKAAAEHFETQARERDALSMAESISESRPDLTPIN